MAWNPGITKGLTVFGKRADPVGACLPPGSYPQPGVRYIVQQLLVHQAVASIFGCGLGGAVDNLGVSIWGV